MAAASYYHDIPSSGSQVNLSNMNNMPMPSPGLQPSHGVPASPPKSPLKPMYLAQAHPHEEVEMIRKADEQLKRRIRTLRIVTRTLSLLLAIAAFVPLALTLHKFLTTRNIYHTVGTTRRTAWALKTKAWPTYMYFSISLASVVINSMILISYARSVKAANFTAMLGTIFTWLVLGADVAIWIVTVVIYRYEKEVTENGKHNDLWGWTCSSTAQDLQKVFRQEVAFDQYCNIQDAGWIAGLLQVGVLMLSVVIYWMVWRRRMSKKMLRQSVRRSVDHRLLGDFR